MKPAPFDYVRPTSLDEALRVLEEAPGGATAIAGGQTLMPLLALRMSEPFILIDLAGIGELRGVRRESGSIHIGPMTSQAEALADETLARHLPTLVEGLRHVGHHQTRNRGTLGGSIAFGEPAAEMPAVALALGARLHCASAGGTREIPADAFYLGPYATALEAGELIVDIEFPDWPGDHLPVFRELARRPGDFALVGLAGALALNGGTIARAGLAWFGMGPTPIRARQVEDALIGRDAASLDFGTLAELAIAETAPFDDKVAGAEYRRIVARRMFASALGEALDTRIAA